MKIYTTKDFEQLNNQKLERLINEGKDENTKYNKQKAEIYFKNASYTRIAYKYRPSYKKGFGHNPKKYFNNPDIASSIIGNQINSIINKKKSNEELNEFEKEILTINIIFPNDESFINLITNYNETNIIGKIIEEIESINSDDETKQKIIRLFTYKKLIKENLEEIIKTCQRVNTYMEVSNQSLIHIYNRLLQIKHTNYELYKKYLKKEKKLVK